MTVLKPTLSIFTGSADFDSVFSESDQINIKFFDFDAPISATSSHLASNLAGKIRLIIVQGSHTGEGFGDPSDTPNQKLENFKATIEAWINNPGIQLTKVYTNSFGNTYNVKAIDWSWKRSFDSPFKIIYSLIMKEVGN